MVNFIFGFFPGQAHTPSGRHAGEKRVRLFHDGDDGRIDFRPVGPRAHAKDATFRPGALARAAHTKPVGLRARRSAAVVISARAGFGGEP